MGSVPLVAGQRYYFEVLHKEAIGEDNVPVAWALPDSLVEARITGAHLLPYQPGSARPTVAAATGQVATDPGLTAPELAAYSTPFTGQTTVEFYYPQ